ncbi:MAG TPA: class I SAM-dependent methyltransferase [Phototrophicaceae bacterium]|jgi:SAM-dependent methyltransferase|nr:class I SAM-dependent methyltransferase [Phototrophicaceae bacterium]
MPGFYSTIARYYDAENTDKNDDIDFYLELAQEHGGPLLDVGCGTGRVMFPLAAAGYEIHGIDNEPAMLERAEDRLNTSADLRKYMKLHAGDVLTYDMPVKFKLTLVPYNGMMHFHDQETQLTVLRQLRKWTRDDGYIILDLPNAGDVFGSQDTEAVTLERTFLEPETGHMVMQQSVSYLDRVNQLMHVTWIYDEIKGDGTLKRTFAPLVLYYYFYSEIRLLLASTGFEVEDVYGDVGFGPYDDGCERMIVIARAK